MEWPFWATALKAQCSTFTNNSAADDGGVIYTSDSSLNISSSAFTNNGAADGVVMIIFDSSLNIISSTTVQLMMVDWCHVRI
jgi:predicted outer membrane repeat protein